jgi:hypothetical protein
MTTLSSYLVERKIASPASMTEALERQAVLGGDLATCLLELRLVREESLTQAIAIMWGIDPAPPGELPATSSALLRLVPGEMAHRFGFYPMTETKGGDLFVAVADPLPPSVEEELSFALGVRLVQRAAPVVRVKQAIARDYGFPLDQRLLRLVDQLDTYPSVVPMPIVSLASPPEDEHPAPASDAGAKPAPPPAPAEPPENFLAQAEAATADKLSAKRKVRVDPLSGSALATWAQRAAGGKTSLADGPQDRVRGPITPAALEEALLDLRTSDEVLKVFFEFARQYFEYAALFVVRADLAEGHDAWGPGASREKVVTIGVPLDLPGLLATARQRRAPVLAPLGREGLDADLAFDLGRTQTRGVVVLPIVVRGRVVALLYGDHAGASVEYSSVGDVIAIAPLVASAFERILVKKKLAAKRAPARRTDPPPDRPVSAPAAVRAAPMPKSWPETEKEMALPTPPPASEEEMVDEGWAHVSDPPDQAKPLDTTPDAPPLAIDRPPPATAAAVRPISERPIPREEPEMIVSEADDEETILALLGEIDEHPAPLVPSSDRSAKRRQMMRRPTPPVRGVGSRAYAADPQAPPASVRLEHPLPAVLLHSDLVEKVIAGDKDADLALSEILALGNAAIPAVFAKFPGPITATRTGSVDDLPRPDECGPVLRIVAAMRRLALPFLAIRSADADGDVRFWATCLLGELHYPDSAIAILARLFDENADVRSMAARGARALLSDGEIGTTIRFGLERMVTRRDEPEQRRVLAIEALAETKSYRSAPAIIRVLDEPSEPIVKAAADALASLTRQGFGRDRRRWDSWWANAGKKRGT